MKIKKLLTISALMLSFLASNLFIGISLAAAANIDCSNPTTSKEQLQCGACEAAGGDCPANPDTSVSKTVSTIINVLSWFVGAIAVIMIIIGGFRYVTSAGNAEGAKSARNTITYAVIGIVIVAVAQIIVHFVIDTTTTATSGASGGSNTSPTASPNPASSNNPNTKP